MPVLKCKAACRPRKNIYPSASYAQDLFKPWLGPYARSINSNQFFSHQKNFWSQILAVVISWQTGNTDQFLASVELYAKSSN